jgi:hypothetical protein
MNLLEQLIVLLMFFLGFLFIFLFIESNKEIDVFMKECLRDHKQYECTALWRSGNKPVAFAPTPIVIGK